MIALTRPRAIRLVQSPSFQRGVEPPLLTEPDAPQPFPKGKVVVRGQEADGFMRTSPHADTCVAWIDISDSVSGRNARDFIGKHVFIGGRNCQIRGASPRPGSALCTRCQRWGHHAAVCRSKGIRCPHCAGPHSADSHHAAALAMKQDPDARSCANCTASKKVKRAHSTTDTSCPFWNHRFDRDWIKKQFPSRT